MNNFLSLVLLHSAGFTQKALSRIFENDENYEDFYNSISLEKLQKFGFKEDKIQWILKKKTELNVTKISELLEKLDVQIITVKNPLYPELLRQAPVHPYFLYVRGNLPSHTNLISVVGSRKSTQYSRAVLSDIIPELVRSGYGIISGWAYWVDSIGHKTTLESGGYTIAVFGTGIDRCYPKENKELFLNILSAGWALISPFPLGTLPEQYNFPIRNEIVAGLSKGTLVTEAAEKSGTLITAGLALDFGRDVFAIPGEVTKVTSSGTNALIRDGQAKLITNAMDILSEYGTMTVVDNEIKVQPTLVFDDITEQTLYEALKTESLDISSLEDKLGIDISTIAFKLSMMEVRGIIEMNIDGSYRVK